MSLDVLITGRLVKPAQERKAANGNAYCLAQVSVPTEGEESLLASCIAFSRSAVDALLVLDKGDAVAVAGKAKLSSWAGSDGTQKHGLNVTIEQVLTVYHVRRRRAAVVDDDEVPAPRRTRAPAAAPAQRTLPATTGGMAEMSDDIPF